MTRVALAFSGGLDTTVCVPLLEDEYGYEEVVGVTVDVGQPESEFDEAAATADALGLEHHVVDAKAEFAELCLDGVRANATYQGYPLGTALARPVIAEKILAVADEHDCTGIAHGCTGKGNDQLRFEAVWRDSDLEVIAPVRELGLTREWEQEYAAERGLPVEGGNEGDWSIDTNLWSRSVEGKELEDPSYVPGEEIYEWTEAPSGETETVEIAFESGYPVAVDVLGSDAPASQSEAVASDDGESMDPVALIEHLNALAGSYGVGRTDTMEDRMLGLKVRENYEHPAATTLLAAHEALEGLVLTQEERQFKAQVDAAWAEKAYEGLIDAPLVDALEAFVDQTQARVTGTVTIRFEGGQARAVGRTSEYAAYSADHASFDTEAVGKIDQADATGVAKYHGFQRRLANESLAAIGREEGDKSIDSPTLATDGGATHDPTATDDGTTDDRATTDDSPE